jgi:prolyl 4-hydroxylase
MSSEMTNIEQQWQKARTLIGQGNVSDAIPFLEMAAQSLHPAAIFHLGCLHLFTLFDSADRNHGKTLIKRATELGHAGAFYQMAMLELSKPGKDLDWHYINECLHKSAELKHPIALRSIAVHWARQDDPSLLRLGTLCLEHAAIGGDLVSLALLMHRLYLGIGCEKNTFRASAINTLLMQSPLALDAPASLTHPRFAEAAQIEALPSLPMPQLQYNNTNPAIEMICNSPWIAIADDVINQEESYLLRYIGTPHLRPSITADPNGKRVQVELRTSFDTMLEEMLDDINLLLMQRRMAAVVGTTPAYSEYLQLLRYQQGQEYRPHRDYLPPNSITPLEAGGAGQRDSTVIMYLNDVHRGGETEFLELNKKITPKMGRVLAFKNLHADGSPDTRTLHAGLPVTHETKWIATLWIHQGLFRKY